MDKYVISEPSPDQFNYKLSLMESIVLSVVSSTQHLDVSAEDQECIAQSVLDAINRYSVDTFGND